MINKTFTAVSAAAFAFAGAASAQELLEMTSGIQAIVKTPEGFVGGADGRREGVAIGD